MERKKDVEENVSIFNIHIDFQLFI